MKIALTGNIGSGKSTVAHLFRVMQVPVFVADDVGKEILGDRRFFSQLTAIFGTEIFDNQNIPNRKKIAGIVFSQPEKLQQLNAIVHPEVTERFLKWTEIHSDSPFVMMESAIIFEAKLEHLFDKIIMVSADENTRIQRVINRDGCSKQAVIARMKQQLSEEEKIKKSDFIIKNDNFHPLIPQIISLQNLLCKS